MTDDKRNEESGEDAEKRNAVAIAKTKPFERVLIAGGAGFVGGHLALHLQQAGHVVTCMDNLLRRGSELNLSRLRDAGVAFSHGDIRCPEDFHRIDDFDLLIDCAAEPSVHAGSKGSPRFVLQNNLVGTLNCLEEARSRGAGFLFLSTSRVYPMQPLNELPFEKIGDRYAWTAAAYSDVVTERGITEDFTLVGARSFYGASKLAGEHLATEYHHSMGVPVLINRCGVLAGPWQMGKVDQGFIALWAARHTYERGLNYTGWGGTGHQVRDLLHVHDLARLIELQLRDRAAFDGSIYNVGGGKDISTSLLELTKRNHVETKVELEFGAVAETNALDMRIYLSDSGLVERTFDWSPVKSTHDIVVETLAWLKGNKALLRPYLG